MLKANRVTRLSTRSLRLQQGGGGMGTFRGIPGANVVEQAAKRRAEEEAREREVLEAAMNGKQRIYVDGKTTSGAGVGKGRRGFEGSSETEDHETYLRMRGKLAGHQKSSALTTSSADSPTLAMRTANDMAVAGSAILASDGGVLAMSARARRNYLRRVSNDFHAYQKRRPLPQVPWLQDTKKTYLDDAERIFGRKENWYMHPDPAVRQKLLMLLRSFVVDTVRECRSLRQLSLARQSKLKRLSSEYAHFMLVAAFDANPVARLKKEWRVPKTAEDLLKEEEERENAPMMELIRKSEGAKRLAAAGGEGGVGGGTQQQASSGPVAEEEGGMNYPDEERGALTRDVTDRLEGSAALADVSHADPYGVMADVGGDGAHPPARAGGNNKKGKQPANENLVDMKKAGLDHMRFAFAGHDGSYTAVQADLRAARQREAAQQYPFLRQRVAESQDTTLDPSLVDWTQSFFPDDTAATFQPPQEYVKRQQELAEEDRMKALYGSAADGAIKGNNMKDGGDADPFASLMRGEGGDDGASVDARMRETQRAVRERLEGGNGGTNQAAPAPRGSAAVRSILGRIAGGPVSSSATTATSHATEGIYGLGADGVLSGNAATATGSSSSGAMDDVDETDLDTLRRARAAERLNNDTILRKEIGTASADAPLDPQQQEYEEELFKLQSKSKRQLNDLKQQTRKEKLRQQRERDRHEGRHSLTQNLRSFVRGHALGFDGEGMLFSGGGGGANSNNLSLANGHNKARVDHQGIPIATRPRSYNVRSKGDLMATLGVSRQRGNTSNYAAAPSFEGAYDDATGEIKINPNAHFARFASSRNASTTAASMMMGNDGASGLFDNPRYGDNDGGAAFVAGGSRRHHQRGGAGRQHDTFVVESNDGISKVDWNTTVLSRQGSAASAGPKWHRANERLVRIARGEKR